MDKEQIFGMAEKEMEYRVELFNNCGKPCGGVDSLYLIASENVYGGSLRLASTNALTKYKENELNMGENTCIDRCVAKYWQVTNLVGKLLGSQRPI